MWVEWALAVVALGCGLLFLAATWQFNHWERKGVPHLKPRPFTGNLGEVFAGKQQLHQKLEEAYAALPEAEMIGMWAANKPILVVRSLELIKHILIKDFHVFVNRSFRVDWDAEPQGARVMFALRDDAWRTVRTKLTPVFTSGKMKMMFPLMVESGNDLHSVIQKEKKQYEAADEAGSLPIGDLSNRLFIDVITSCAFGCKGGALTDPTTSIVYQVLCGILNLNWKQSIGFLCMLFGPWPLYRLLCRIGFGFYERRKLDAVSRLVETETERRDLGGKKRADKTPSDSHSSSATGSVRRA